MALFTLGQYKIEREIPLRITSENTRDEKTRKCTESENYSSAALSKIRTFQISDSLNDNEKTGPMTFRMGQIGRLQKRKNGSLFRARVYFDSERFAFCRPPKIQLV